MRHVKQVSLKKRVAALPAKADVIPVSPPWKKD
jgi:hypothetical protein